MPLFAVLWSMSLGGNDPKPAIPTDNYTGAYHIVTKPERRVEVTVSVEAKVPEGSCRGWAVVVPVAPETAFQKEVSTRIEPAELADQFSSAPEQSPLSRPTLRAEFDVPGSTIAYRVIYRANMWSRHLEPGPPAEAVAPLVASLHRIYTSPSRTCDFEAPSVRSWIQSSGLIPRRGESELAFAFRALVGVRAMYPYEAPGKGPDWFTCSQTLERKTADCGASNLLLAAVLRFSGIPARVYCGRHALVGIPAENNSHSRLDFFVDGVGWVPADATMPTKQGDASQNAMAFGVDPGWYLSDHEETDLVVPLPVFGDQTLTWMHAYTVPYRTAGFDTWSQFSSTERVTCRNIDVLGNGWYARQSVRG